MKSLLTIIFASLISVSLFAQTMEFNNTSGLQMDVLSNNSCGVYDKVTNYSFYGQRYRFSMPVGIKKSDLFDMRKAMMHNDLSKFMRSSIKRTELYGEINNQFVTYEDQYTARRGYQLGVKGFQYRMIHSYVMYDLNYTHFGSGNSLDRGTNFISGQLGVYTVRNMSRAVYFGVYTLMGKSTKILIPLLGFRIRSSRSWETKIMIPVELKITRKWENKSFWTEFRTYLNGNITNFGLKGPKTPGANVIQVMNFRSGIKHRQKLNDHFNLSVELGWEYGASIISYGIADFYGSKHRPQSRMYGNFSLSYQLKGSDDIGKFFEFY